MYEKRHLINSDPYKRPINKDTTVKNVYYGEVIDINDPLEGGRIKVRISGIDDKTSNTDLVWSTPLLPKFFHIYPKVGEAVRIIFDDNRYPQRGRQWMGSIIAQPQNRVFESYANSFSTTNVPRSSALKAPSTFPEANGVFPTLEDVALLGRDNADIILRKREVELRAGLHLINDILSLNKQNPASHKLSMTEDGKTSSSVLIADKIALLSHEGIPKFKAYGLDEAERTKIFEQGHPIPRGDVLVQALEILRKAIITHIHGYSGISADKSGTIIDLEKINFENMLQNNIVIN